MSTGLVKLEDAKGPIQATARGLTLSSLDEMYRFAGYVASSGMAPKGMNRDAILVAMQLGMEVGLSPMQSLQNVAVINGRPGIFGDAALALARSSGLMEWIEEKVEGEGDSRHAVCRTKRAGDPKPQETTFSVADAKRAGLWGKAGPWTQYPDRMLLFRARGFRLRDSFPDALRGFKTVEELQDYPDAGPKHVQATVEPSPSQVEPAPPNGKHEPEEPSAPRQEMSHLHGQSAHDRLDNVQAATLADAIKAKGSGSWQVWKPLLGIDRGLSEIPPRLFPVALLFVQLDEPEANNLLDVAGIRNLRDLASREEKDVAGVLEYLTQKFSRQPVEAT